MKTVPLATFNELVPARSLQGRLEQAGIPALIHDESKLERFWFMSEPLAAVHLEVAQPDYLRARQLAEELNQREHLLKDAVRCLECQSTRVEFPQLSRKFVMPRLASVFMALGLVPREFYCLDCHYTWPTVMPVEPKRDRLGWSYESKHWHPETAEHPRRT